ncbi:iron-containing redox enzyme family protein [Nocardioides sp. Bht2]|uniref:iron-containing redox enzyme family protein n=1 Tax=Nocardioides sp. Bht2 TaxID=3392297 RepID=UPI0039B6E296
MFLPQSRGPVSAWVRRRMLGLGADQLPEPPEPEGLLDDDDVQLALWMMYEMHYVGFDEVDPALEWDLELLAMRQLLEAPFELALRGLVASVGVGTVGARPSQIVDALRQVIDDAPDAGLARHLQRRATADQFADFLRQRSIYHLKEADAHSFVLPRLRGSVKVALAEVQYDEYGAGRAERLHQDLFASAMVACGLDARYGRYLDDADAATLAASNALSFACLHRRNRAIAAGHLAAFEATSSLPCRRICQGVERLGLPREVFDYYDEHVEADAVHEQIALTDLCGGLVADEPELAGDVLFGAQLALYLGARADRALLKRWSTSAASPAATNGAGQEVA